MTLAKQSAIFAMTSISLSCLGTECMSASFLEGTLFGLILRDAKGTNQSGTSVV